ncbi:MAG: N-acetylmuramoyl-L-alanine amidase [Candidatus Aphodosoma sp.]|nr:N-acetylmuramoyl-L-alanine amidase [Candidatus Aphodosoma sp.]
MKINKIYCIIIFLLITTISFGKDFTVVIDPGHGGKDPGAVGKIGREKEINLKVALMLGEMITTNHKDVKVVYTRKTDKYVTLQQRPAIANEADGDLFISIHTNASESRSASGSETFTLGLSKSDANFEVAKRENSVMLLENDHESYQGFDPTSPESYIMFEFMQSKYIDQSVEIAYYTQKEFVAQKRLDRGVRQAIFWVLHQVKMPSILIELGFITNSAEEQYLISFDGQNAYAKSIYNAFKKYKHEYDKRTISVNTSGTTVKEKPEPEKETFDKQTEKKVTEKKESSKEEVKEVTKPDKAVDKKGEDNIKKQNNTTSQNEKKDEIKKESNENKSAEQKTNTEKKYPATNNLNIVFKIQAFSAKMELEKNHSDLLKLKNFQPISFIKENNWYKYSCIETQSYAEAEEKLVEVRKKFKDAFIIAFKDGKKISVKEALELIKTK